MTNTSTIADDIIEGRSLSEDNALSLWESDSVTLFSGANRIREHFKGRKINLCSIINAKSGACSENCAFCAQSAKHTAKVEKYPLVSSSAVSGALETAVNNRAGCFGIITSGKALSKDEVERICGYVSENKDRGIRLSASLGELDDELLKKLKASGLKRFHHNIETAESFYPNICSTHSFSDRFRTAKAVKKAGLELCSGGIFGLGETRAQRVEFAFALRELGADSIPLNFLNPIEGTPLAGKEPLSCEEILKCIAVVRYILPDKDISVCGGREVNLRDLQSWIFFAGANGMMTGNYLTTSGRGAEQDLRMIKDLGLEINNYEK